MNLQKKKIMLITNHGDDIYCFRKEVIESLVEYGYEVLVSCPYGDKIELMKSIQFEYEDITIDRRGINPLKDIRLFLSYIRLLRKHRPDVVLTYTVKPNVYASLAATILGIKYINNVTGLGSVLTMGSCVRSLVLLLFRISFRKSNCVFFQNEYNMKMLKTLGLISGDSKLIPGSGVNIERYPVQQYPNGGNGIQGETIVFNYIGRILKEKGIDTYLAAAQIIKSRYPKTEFNIIGFIEPTESHYELKIRDLEKKGIVYYLGQQKDVIPHITRSHAIIHPSVYGEGMSNVLLENASSGRVLITTDNPGCKEIVKDRETGYIFQGGNVEELVSILEVFLGLENEKRKEMGIQGRMYIEQYFSRQIVIDAYLDKIKGVLDE